LWVSTSILVCSSVALEMARYTLRRGKVAQFRMLLQGTLALGLGFLVVQATALYELATQGVGLGQNLHGSAFYIFMGLHGLHLLVGIVWLAYLLYRSNRLRDDVENDLRRHRYALGAAALYWHFMGGLWVVLFALLMVWSQAI
jgi:cytochrome c oxidase subunit 3